MSLLGYWITGAKTTEDEFFNVFAERTYQAASTDANELALRAALPFVPCQSHPVYPAARVLNIQCDLDGTASTYNNPLDPTDVHINDDCYYWTVTVSYGPVDPLTHSFTGNPLDQPPTVDFNWTYFDQACDVAVDPNTGKFVPVLNSAGDPFDPPVTREGLRGSLRASWNVLTFSPYALFQYGNNINSDYFLGFPPGTIKLSPPQMPERPYSQFLDRNYFRISATFDFNPQDGGWNPKPIDRGFRYNDGSGNLFKIYDPNGQPVAVPALLDGSGGILFDTTLFQQKEYQVYPSTSFSGQFPALVNIFA